MLICKAFKITLATAMTKLHFPKCSHLTWKLQTIRRISNSPMLSNSNLNFVTFLAPKGGTIVLQSSGQQQYTNSKRSRQITYKKLWSTANNLQISTHILTDYFLHINSKTRIGYQINKPGMGLPSTPRKRQNLFAKMELEHPKFEGHVIPNKDEYQKSV